MFKKHPQPKPSANIKSSERRALLASICDLYKFKREDLTKEKELDLLPAIIKQASYQSIQGHKGTIYYDTTEQPVWFKSRDSQLYPTIYTLWRAAYLLPIVLTNPHVIGKLIGNANLMLPGCIPPFDPRMLRGALVGVASYDSPTVIKAIGHCSLNLTQFDDVVGRLGTAVTIIHTVDDELFKLYDEDVEVPESVDNEVPAAQVPEEGEQLEEETATEVNEEVVNDEVNDLTEAIEEILIEDIDNFFTRSFIQSVKLNPKMELPLSASKFMADYILKNLPRMDAKYCNIKKTSWKKSAKFLKALEKLKYLSLKGKGDDVTVVAITIDPEVIANFVTHKTSEQGKGASNSNQKDEKKLSVLSLYKPTSKSRMVFNKTNLDFQKLYTLPELKAILNDYIKIMDLVYKANPKLIVMDSTLASIAGLGDERAPRDKLFTLFLKNFSPNYAILKPGETADSRPTVHKGEPPKIKILTQNVLGRKKITCVLDFERFYIKPLVLAEDLKNKCSGSTSIGPCNHNPNLTEVMVQGPHGPTVVEYLKDKGVPISFIDFEDKSKGKKKRPQN